MELSILLNFYAFDNKMKCIFNGYLLMKDIDIPMHNRLINFNSTFQVVAHQYTETSKVSDVSGDCDINNFNEGILLRSKWMSEPKSETYEFFSNKTRCLQSILGI